MNRAALLSLVQRHRNAPAGQQLTTPAADLIRLIGQTQAVISGQPVMLKLTAAITLVGDIHGQFDDLKRIFDHAGWPPGKNYLFLGDYVDRGDNQLETIGLLYALKLLYPNNFFLLRGNHESPEVNEGYGFLAVCQERYGAATGEKIFHLFNASFLHLPLSAVIDGRIFASHGGIPKGIRSLQQLQDIQRPYMVDPEGWEVDLLWADPSERPGWHFNDARHVGHTFGADAAAEFCRQFRLDLIVRGHQVCPNGFDRLGEQIITIFSAPNYGGGDNDAGVMHIDADLLCSFAVLRAG